MLSLLAGIGGGLLKQAVGGLFNEGKKYVERKQDAKLKLELSKQESLNRIAEHQVMGEAQIQVKKLELEKARALELQAQHERAQLAMKDQTAYADKTGFMNNIIKSVRPVLTYLIIIFLVAIYFTNGADSPIQATLTASIVEFCAVIIGFWFGDRPIRRK